jgi:hypothetical protein
VTGAIELIDRDDYIVGKIQYDETLNGIACLGLGRSGLESVLGCWRYVKGFARMKGVA